MSICDSSVDCNITAMFDLDTDLCDADTNNTMNEPKDLDRTEP